MTNLTIGTPHLFNGPTLGSGVTYSYPGDKDHKKPIMLPPTMQPYGSSIYEYFERIATQAIKQYAEKNKVSKDLALQEFAKQNIEQSLKLLTENPEELLKNHGEYSFGELVSQGARRVYTVYHDNNCILKDLVSNYAQIMIDLSSNGEVNPTTRKIVKNLGEKLQKLVARSEADTKRGQVWIDPNWIIDL